MLNLYNFILENRIVDGKSLNDPTHEEYIRRYAYNVSANRHNMIMSSRGIGITTLLKTTINYYLMNGFNVIFIDPLYRNSNGFIRDVILNEMVINEFLGSIGLPEKQLIETKHNEFFYDRQFFKYVKLEKSIIRGFNLYNSVIIIDNATYLPIFNVLTDLSYASPHKIIVNSDNVEVSEFSSIFYDSRLFPNLNRVELDYSLSSRLLGNEKELIQKHGEEFFNKAFKLL